MSKKNQTNNKQKEEDQTAAEEGEETHERQHTSTEPSAGDDRTTAASEQLRPRPIGPVPAFLDRTYAMVDEKGSDEIVSWGALGDTFVIKRLDLFEEEVIPRFFNHRNLFSFVRQLNNHGFSKVRQGHSSKNSPSKQGAASVRSGGGGRGAGAASGKGKQDPNVWWEFKHSNFQRGRRELMSEIKRRKEKSSSHSASAQAGVSDEVLNVMRKEMEKVKGALRVMDQKLDSLKELVISLSARGGGFNGLAIPTAAHNGNPRGTSLRVGEAPMHPADAIGGSTWGVMPDENGRRASGCSGGGTGVIPASGGWGSQDGGGGGVGVGMYPPTHLLQQQQQQIQRVQPQQVATQQEPRQHQPLWHQHQNHARHMWQQQQQFSGAMPPSHGMPPPCEVSPGVAAAAASGRWPGADASSSWQQSQQRQLPQSQDAPRTPQSPDTYSPNTLSGVKRKASFVVSHPPSPQERPTGNSRGGGGGGGGGGGNSGSGGGGGPAHQADGSTNISANGARDGIASATDNGHRNPTLAGTCNPHYVAWAAGNGGAATGQPQYPTASGSSAPYMFYERHPVGNGTHSTGNGGTAGGAAMGVTDGNLRGGYPRGPTDGPDYPHMTMVAHETPPVAGMFLGSGWGGSNGGMMARAMPPGSSGVWPASGHVSARPMTAGAPAGGGMGPGGSGGGGDDHGSPPATRSRRDRGGGRREEGGGGGHPEDNNVDVKPQVKMA